MKLINLINTAINDNKIEEMEVIEMLIDKLEKERADAINDVYKCIYKKSYGITISKDLAESIVKSMAVTDNSDRENGQKWTMDQTSSVGSQLGVDWSKITKTDYYLVMNMQYSDMYKTAEKYDLQNDPQYFGSLARDWLCDKDAGENKLFNYVFKVIL